MDHVGGQREPPQRRRPCRAVCHGHLGWTLDCAVCLSPAAKNYSQAAGWTGAAMQGTRSEQRPGQACAWGQAE